MLSHGNTDYYTGKSYHLFHVAFQRFCCIFVVFWIAEMHVVSGVTWAET